MAFYNFKNLNLNLNGNLLATSEIQLESQLDIIHPLFIDERMSERNMVSSPYHSSLKLRYFLTGQDYLKKYLYALENESITGNFCGLNFVQGYISDYSVAFGPNTPIEIVATIEVFDQITGTFTPAKLTNNNGTILRTSDIRIDNLTNYTSSPITNIIQASFNYNCKLNPSYSYDSGNPITDAERISIEDRKWNMEIISDSVDMNIPPSGDKFAITISGINPFNNNINESYSISGIAYSKQLNITNNKVHSHVIRLSQSHSSNQGAINAVSINNSSNIINVYSDINTHPFTNRNLNCIDKIIIGDTLCTGFSVLNTNTGDQINIPIPANVINGPLSIYSSKGNLFWPSNLNFTYPSMSITNVSQNTGYPGTPIYISGNNFYRIGQITYGGVSSAFQTISPNLILSIVPANGITDRIQITSSLRSTNVSSNNYFYCQPSITLLTPVTGVWGDSLTIGGANFSGTTGVKFGTGMVDAASFSISSNNILSIQSPLTGAGYSEGYITVLTSGGSSQSISRYIPQVPLYGFSINSGIYFDTIILSLNVDSGYLYPTGGGYKIRLGGIDTIFYQKGTGLSGQVPFGGETDYIYVYRPDGVGTYTPNPNQFIVHSKPQIYSITPAIVNQYSYFNPVLVGQNFEFFTSNLPWFFAISGGLNGDMQTTTNIIANSGGNADTIYIPNFIVTGQTGYYDLIVRNFAGSGIFKSGLLVNTGINQSLSCIATISPTNNRFNTNDNPSFAIDNSTGTYAKMLCTNISSGSILSITAKNNNVMKINLIKILMDGVPSSYIDGYTQGDGKGLLEPKTYFQNTSGEISLWFKKATKPFYNSEQINLNDFQFILFNSGITGVATVKIATPQLLNANLTQFLGLTEVQIY